jgi:hypothetical protein
MRWEGDHYIKAQCEEPGAVPKDIGLLRNFKKLEPECRTDFFFNPDGSAKVWYYKAGDKNLELFSVPGLNPVNGKTLKPITEYMIGEHLCDSTE